MKKEKRDFLYKKATEELLSKATVIDEELKQIKDLRIHYSVSYLTKYLRTAFKNERAMDFVFESSRKSYTYSSLLCDTLFLIYGSTGGNKFWRIKYVNPKDWDGGPHWYLETKSGIVFDITFDQYSIRKIKIPYDLSRDYSNMPYNKIGNLEKTERLAKVCNIDFNSIIMENKNRND